MDNAALQKRRVSTFLSIYPLSSEKAFVATNVGMVRNDDDPRRVCVLAVPCLRSVFVLVE